MKKLLTIPLFVLILIESKSQSLHVVGKDENIIDTLPILIKMNHRWQKGFVVFAPYILDGWKENKYGYDADLGNGSFHHLLLNENYKPISTKSKISYFRFIDKNPWYRLGL